jgi:hypothetical protein
MPAKKSRWQSREGRLAALDGALQRLRGLDLKIEVGE